MAINSDAAMAVALFVSTASVAWSAAFAWSRWLARPRESIATSPEHQEYLDRRIARVEHALDSITAELAQLGEAQRAMGQLIAERPPVVGPPPRPAGQLPRVNTPR